MYNIFVTKQHPAFIQRLMIWLNESVVDYAIELAGKTSQIRLLEIGPGKGYFFRACQRRTGIVYHALDRNRSILEGLEIPAESIFLGELPQVDNLGDQKFDIVYMAYVLEHLENGKEIYQSIMALKEQIQPGGFLVLQVPNTEKLGMEFWNMDYTHHFPTTKRNMTQVLNDCGISRIKIFDISGLITYKWFYRNRFPYYLLRILTWFYCYKTIGKLFGWLVHTPVSDLDNIFYKSYALLKAENLFIVAKNGEAA